MRALQKNNHEPCNCKKRKSVSVGSVCVLSELWLELLAKQRLLLLLLLLYTRLDAIIFDQTE